MSDSSCQIVKDWWDSLPAIVRYIHIDYKILDNYKWDGLNEIDKQLVTQFYDGSHTTKTEEE